MINFKKIRNLLAGLSLTLVMASPVYAANYTVASGDSLYSIGKLFNTTSDIIMKNSSLSNSSIYPGQVLNVPASVYTIASGDSLYLIAKRYGISLYNLRQANHIWNDSIYVGEKLLLPKIAPSTSNSYTSSDLDLLSRLIMAEAQDQPYTAKVAVGAVVLNRVKSSVFPNTISSVIYQKDSGYYQFTPVQNGWINKAASTECVQAAKDALNGTDPSHGALYYFDDSTTNKWLWSKTIAARIGKMVFVY